MALVRCTHHGKPERGSRDYVRSVEPVGYPQTAAVCGRHECERPGLIWLEAQEAKAYDAGQRVFFGQTSVMRVRAA